MFPLNNIAIIATISKAVLLHKIPIFLSAFFLANIFLFKKRAIKKRSLYEYLMLFETNAILFGDLDTLSRKP